MAGIVAALEAHHRRRAVGEPVHHLALTLIAPLGTDDDDVLAHAQPRTNSSNVTPPAMLKKPAMRSTRSSACCMPARKRRKRTGDRKGTIPSMTSNSPTA